MYIIYIYLVDGWWLPFGLFSHKYWVAIIIPIDELIFSRGVAQPPTRLFTWQNTWLAINHDISTNS